MLPLQHAADGKLSERGQAAFQEFVADVWGGYTPPWFHGIEHLTIDHDGYVSWKGKRIEHYEPGWAYAEETKRQAEELAERCRQLAAMGKEMNKANVVRRREDFVEGQPVTTEKGR